MTREDYVKDLEGCEFHFIDRGICGCSDGKIIDGGKQVVWYSSNDKKMVGDLRKLPKCWAEACWMSHANYEWPGGIDTEDVKESLKEAEKLFAKLYI